MSIQLLHGDCLELMQQIPDSSVDMVLCDLPYGMTRNKWDTVIPFEPLWREYRRVCKLTAAIVLNCQQPFSSALVLSNPREFRYMLYWDKHLKTNFLNVKKQPLRQVEEIAVFYRRQCHFAPPPKKEGKAMYGVLWRQRVARIITRIKRGLPRFQPSIVRHR